ncbi:hypothetical protein QYF36_011582 [Acer negundo]|nr:hypothetical protein QYF36_011582 [Acer negundo]
MPHAKTPFSRVWYTHELPHVDVSSSRRWHMRELSHTARASPYELMHGLDVALTSPSSLQRRLCLDRKPGFM